MLSFPFSYLKPLSYKKNQSNIQNIIIDALRISKHYNKTILFVYNNKMKRVIAILKLQENFCKPYQGSSGNGRLCPYTVTHSLQETYKRKKN